MISCRGGIPFGNSAFNSASRSAVGRVRRRPSVDAVRRVRALLELRPEALAVLVRAARVVEVVVVRPRDWRRPEFVLLEVPTTPCACRRWAPSAAARENVRPHSGHVNSCCVVGSVRARAIATTSMFGSGADSLCEAPSRTPERRQYAAATRQCALLCDGGNLHAAARTTGRPRRVV